MEKDDKKLLKEKYKQGQKDIFLRTLPLPVATFKDLFEFVNAKLELDGCDHSMDFTLEYLKEHNLNQEEVVDFMNENGAFCDCEVIYNVEQLLENL